MAVFPPGRVFVEIQRIRVRGNIGLSPIRFTDKDTSGEDLGEKNSTNRLWQRWKQLRTAEKIGLCSVVVAVIGIGITAFAQIYYPEIRAFLRLDPPKPQIQLPLQTQILVAETAPNVSEIRLKHNVNMISELESEKTTSEVQPDSFGFAYPSSVTYGLPVTLVRAESPRSFEIHKLHDSSIVIVGFVGPESFVRLREGVHTKDEITFFSSATKYASELICLPANRIKCDRVRNVETASAADCRVVE